MMRRGRPISPPGRPGAGARRRAAAPGWVLAAWLLLAAVPAAAQGVRIAVFPVEDLSQGVNGVSWSVTERLSKALEARGFEVAAAEAVRSFLVRNHVRTLGYLDTFHVFKARRELDVDLVLLGCVTQRTERPCPTVGLALNLVRARDARSVWAAVESLSCRDARHPLGLFEPTSIEDLWPTVTEAILRRWPRELEVAAARLPLIEIASADVSPRYVRAGERVTARVEVRVAGAGDDFSAWLDVGGGAPVSMRPLGGGGFFAAEWAAPNREGRLPATLELRWPSGRKRKIFVGTYHVDTTPPRLTVAPRGVRLGDKVAFRRDMTFVPRLLDPEPVTRWAVTIRDAKGQVVVHQETAGGLPDRLVWSGKKSDGFRAGQGEYTFTVEAWDRAGNKAAASASALLVANPPGVLVRAAPRRDGGVRIDIRQEGMTDVAYWHVEVRSRDGSVLETREGTRLPAALDLPETVVREGGVECIVTAQDALGNRARREMKDVLLAAAQGQEEEKKPVVQDTWAADF
ncbi:hypothetical protein G3N55_01495 [Dissulfurirhabdus thermomarina]|uniref:FlgD/Vpr Ig-like domain-containing protein n=1 Tax=Dissulfurirhabdus thermomarina TaxID=1765737 RepID=A0A6N9TKC4_DISTH|nr:FlgD immunoglobulin-like domain containing protein [Dissulfurirhabdus thermomarina]NDY41528.1 hypothetical protein [Dissulfurirhabdus thermomarina]NMX22953.1 hypothetical protein [Dissulfurirhabdus thermomarina]